MATSNQYIPAFYIDEVLVDKVTGEPLAGGIVTFYNNEQPSVLKYVYQKVGTANNYSFVLLPNPMTLSSSGQFVDSIGNNVIPYFLPYDAAGDVQLYDVNVESAAFVQQFRREGVPYVDTGDSPSNEANILTANEITNPQFVQVSFWPTTSFVFNVTGSNTVNQIAPGWDIVTTGTGTVTLSQVTSISTTAITNPPYALSITSAGISSLVLRQRLQASPRLLANGFLSGYFIAAASADVELTLSYVPSSGDSHVIVQGTTTNDSVFNAIFGVTEIGGTINTNPAPTGYVDIQLDIPVGASISVSSFEIIGVSTSTFTTVPFFEQTTPRQINNLFHYYYPLLSYKPIPSYLVGWDFPINYAQANLSTVGPIAGVNTSYYTWDQTIVFQTKTNGVTTTRATNRNMVLTSNTGANSFAISQYLDRQAKEILSAPFCINLRALSTLTAPICTISVWWTADASVPTLPSNFITSLDSNGLPAVIGTWNQVPRSNWGNPTFNLTSSMANYGWAGFDASATSASTTATHIAVVIGFGTVVSGGTVQIESCSLQAGSIPTIPAPVTPEQSLLDCELYYEKTYTVGDPVGSATAFGAILARQTTNATGTQFHNLSFGYAFRAIKRISSPIVTLYSTSGTSAAVSGVVSNIGGSSSTGDVAISNWTQAGLNSQAVYYIATTGVSSPTIVGPVTRPDGYILFQATVDARLGVV